jgi:outer membrane protein TolC
MPEMQRSDIFIDFTPSMVTSRPHGRIGLLFAIGMLAMPIGALGQAPSNLSPLPEDLIPALRPILVSALAQSPQMIARNIDLANAEGVRISDRAGMLPSLGTTLQYGNNTTTSSYATSTSSSSNVGFFYSVYANQAIYHWGALKAQADIGKIGVRIAERNYAEAYRLLIVSVRTQFMTLIGKKIGLRNATFALQQAEEALAAVKDKVKAKTLPPGADVGPQLGVDDARLARDRIIEDLENSQRVFALSVGLNDFGGQNIPEEIPRPAYAPEVSAQLLQQFVQEQGERTYTIANLHDEIKQADLSYRITKVRLRPMVGFNAYYSQQPTASVSSDHSVSQYITQSRNFDIVASWSIFDGLATRGAKLSALSSKRSYERTLRTTVDQAMAQARDLAQQLAFAWRALDLSQRRCDMAESAVSGVTDNVKRGLMSANEIGAAQLSFNQSELILAITRADFLNQWSQFVSTLCVDPMLTTIPDRYLPDGK